MKYTDPQTGKEFETTEVITRQKERGILVPIWVTSEPSDWIPTKESDTIKVER